MARAIRDYRTILENNDNILDNETNFMIGICVAFHTFITRNDPANVNGRSALQWFKPFQTIKGVIQSSVRSAWLQESSFARLFPIWKLPTPHPYFKDKHLNSPLAFLIEGIESDDEETQEAYKFCMAYVSEMLLHPDRRFILPFLGNAPPRFVELLDAEDPRAMVIAGSFFSLIALVKHIWFLDGTGKHELRTIYATLPKEWVAKLDRAQREIGAIVVRENHIFSSATPGEFLGPSPGSSPASVEKFGITSDLHWTQDAWVGKSEEVARTCDDLVNDYKAMG